MGNQRRSQSRGMFPRESVFRPDPPGTARPEISRKISTGAGAGVAAVSGFSALDSSPRRQRFRR